MHSVSVSEMRCSVKREQADKTDRGDPAWTISLSSRLARKSRRLVCPRPVGRASCEHRASQKTLGERQTGTGSEVGWMFYFVLLSLRFSRAKPLSSVSLGSTIFYFTS